MTKKMKEKQIKHLLFLFSILSIITYQLLSNVSVYAADESKTELEQSKEFTISAPSAILMEASTGQIIYEKEADAVRSPASITKIMTLLLIFENLEKGTITLDDQVVTSAYAKSMGGSQVFLEEGELQSVDTLIKCITVASGNDASVAMAEKIAGSEQAFVDLMNHKVKSLGLSNTHFIDCCGLTNSPDHYTCARDIAIMARELITKYPQIYDYSKIWMDSIVHTTAKGSKEFTLSSTNKLLKQYSFTTGLKTGSTSLAKYCFCATARKNDMDLIAVVMACDTPKERFADAHQLLEYGYAKAKLFVDKEIYKNILQVECGKEDCVEVKTKIPFRYLDVAGKDISRIEKKIEIDTILQAPIKKNEQVGNISYYLNDIKIGENPIVSTVNIDRASYKDVAYKVLFYYLL